MNVDLETNSSLGEMAPRLSDINEFEIRLLVMQNAKRMNVRREIKKIEVVVVVKQSRWKRRETIVIKSSLDKLKKK